MKQIAVLLLIFVPFQIYGKEQSVPPMSGDRPDVTEGAVTVPKGSVQLESGYTYSYTENDYKEHSAGEALFRVGLLDPVELRLGPGSWMQAEGDDETYKGKSDVYGGFKFSLYRGTKTSDFWKPDLAILTAATFPVADNEFSGESWTPGGILVAGWGLTDMFFFGASGIMNVPEGENGRYRDYGVTAVLGAGFDWGLGIYVEYFSVMNENDGGDTVHSIDGGFTFLVSDNFQLDIRGGRELNGDDKNTFAGIGFVGRMLNIL